MDLMGLEARGGCWRWRGRGRYRFGCGCCGERKLWYCGLCGLFLFLKLRGEGGGMLLAGRCVVGGWRSARGNIRRCRRRRSGGEGGRLGRRRRSGGVACVNGCGKRGTGEGRGLEGGHTPPAPSCMTRIKELSRGRRGEAHLL